MSGSEQQCLGKKALRSVEGIFHRAVDPAYREFALSGSRLPGRYSRADQPTLYLSASPEGVEVAMRAHKGDRSQTLSLVSVRVRAENIFDLRDPSARAHAGINLEDATAPWQELVRNGQEPRSWKVRDQLEALGAQGLMDPSRKSPGLWHLVLFTWNRDHAPAVQLADERPPG